MRVPGRLLPAVQWPLGAVEVRGRGIRLKVGGSGEGGLGFGIDHGSVRGEVSGLGENNTVGKKYERDSFVVNTLAY